MSSNDQPFIDSNEVKLETSVAQRYKNRSEAFWAGIRDAAGAPAMVLFAGMVGFGAMGKTSGMDAWFTTATSFFMFALPGQVVLLEMAITGSSLVAIALAVTLTSTRFITMTVTLFPQFHEKDRNHGLYASVHLLAMTAWAISIPGTILGYLLAGVVPPYITLGLVFINPLFFLLTFTEVKPWVNRIAIGLGFVLGPFFFLLDRDTSLLTTGLVGGTIAYVFDRKVLRKRAGVMS